MSRKLILLKFILVPTLLFLSCTPKDNTNFAELENLYLGQKILGDTSEIFAPGIISSNNQEHSSLSFSPDGKEIWWSIWRLPLDMKKYPQVIQYIKFENGEWSKPKTASFSGRYRDGSPAFSPDGNRIYFYSRRPLNAETEVMHDIDLWFVERTDTGWSIPMNVGEPINTQFVEATPCFAANGNLYFTSNRSQYDDPTGSNDIFVSVFKDGKFNEPISVGFSINTDYARETSPYITPDESYIIFSRDSRRFDKEGNLIDGDRKLMISFRDDKGVWQNPVEMGEEFYDARFPSVSPDGKYLFFTKYSKKTSEDFYWIDAKIIEKLKPE